MKPRTIQNIKSLYKLAQKVCSNKTHEYTGDPVGLVLDMQLALFPPEVHPSGDIKRAMRETIEDAIRE